MQSLEKICEILGLKRNNLEREMAAIDSQISLIDNQVAHIHSEHLRMSEAVFAGKLSNDVARDVQTLEAWKTKTSFQAENLKVRKSELIESRKPLEKELAATIVKDKMIDAKRRAQDKARYALHQEAQSSERLETWINARF